jgi:hypothetical protein
MSPLTPLYLIRDSCDWARVTDRSMAAFLSSLCRSHHCGQTNLARNTPHSAPWCQRQYDHDTQNHKSNHNSNTYLGIIPIAFNAAATNSEQKKDSCSAVDADADEGGEAPPPLFVSFDKLRNTPPMPLPAPLLPLRSGGVLADAVKKKEDVWEELFGDGKPPEAVPSSQSSAL